MFCVEIELSGLFEICWNESNRNEQTFAAKVNQCTELTLNTIIFLIFWVLVSCKLSTWHQDSPGCLAFGHFGHLGLGSLLSSVFDVLCWSLKPPWTILVCWKERQKINNTSQDTTLQDKSVVIEMKDSWFLLFLCLVLLAAVWCPVLKSRFLDICHLQQFTSSITRKISTENLP